MKKYASIVFLAVLCLSIAMIANAQQREPRGGGEDYNYCPYCGTALRPGGGYGHGMGPGMMHRGWGRGPGMMGQGYGPGMMGQGYGPGMMERGRGGYGYRQDAECQMFLNDTVEQRKKLQEKRFEYAEAYRDPKSTNEQLDKLGKEIAEIEDKIAEKAPRDCWRF